MINELESMAVSECIHNASKIRELSNSLMGTNREGLSELQIQQKVFEISSLSERIERWQRALMANVCACSSNQ